eukprot:SM000184S03784  [mRNA]  locus=s184:201673:213965:- [translate_table: standard]
MTAINQRTTMAAAATAAEAGAPAAGAASALALATSCSRAAVDAKLWWDPFGGLLASLDGLCAAAEDNARREGAQKPAALQQAREVLLRRRASELAESLGEHRHWLLATLDGFLSPSSSSRAALEGTSVQLGSRELKVEPALRASALRASNFLLLDEVQAYLLVSRAAAPAGRAGVDDDTAVLQKAISLYFEERQCLLKCVRLLMMLRPDGDGYFGGDDVLAKVVQEAAELVQQVLAGNLVNLVVRQLTGKEPKHLVRVPAHGEAEAWQQQWDAELVLLLDLLLTLHVVPPSADKLTAAAFLDLLQAFQRHLFLPAVDTGDRQRARHLAMLLLLDGLHLEGLLAMLQAGTPAFTQGAHHLGIEDVNQLGAAIVESDPRQHPETAPLLLAWASFSSLLAALPPHASSSPLQLADPAETMWRAHQGRAFAYILGLLQSTTCQNPELDSGEYKRILKLLIAAFLASFEVKNQVNLDDIRVVIDILSEIYTGEADLCCDFWDSRKLLDAPIRALLSPLLDSFPDNADLLLRFLSSLSEGLWPAECVCAYVLRLVHVAMPYQLSAETAQSLEEVGGEVEAAGNGVPVPLAPILRAPAGTRGQIVKFLDSSEALVRWEAQHVCIVVLMLRCVTVASHLGSAIKSQRREMRLLLLLIDRVLTSNKKLVQVLLAVDQDPSVAAERSDGRMQPTARVELIPFLGMLMRQLSRSQPDAATMALVTANLAHIAHCCPGLVLKELQSSPLSEHDAAGAGGAMLQQLLRDEQATGEYDLTLSVLVEKGSTSEWVVSLLRQLALHVLEHAATWRYNDRVQRWQVVTKAIRAIMAALSRVSWTARQQAPDQRDDLICSPVLKMLLTDFGLQGALFRLLVVDFSALRKFQSDPAIGRKESDAFEEALLCSLALLHDLIEAVCTSRPATAHASLAEMLHKGAVVGPVASLLKCEHNQSMQKASLQALQALSKLPMPVSLSVASPDSSQVAHLRSYFAGLLAKDVAAAYPDLTLAALDLLIAAVPGQPALVDFFLSPPDPSRCNGDKEDNLGEGKGLEALWALVQQSAVLLASDLGEVLARVLTLLVRIWNEPVGCYSVVRWLLSKPTFWLTATTSLFTSSSAASAPSPSADADDKSMQVAKSCEEMEKEALHLTCEALAFQLMALDVFLQARLLVPAESATCVGDTSRAVGESGALQVLRDWHKLAGTGPQAATAKFAEVQDDHADIYHQSKKYSQLVLVGLVSKVLEEDKDGLDENLVACVQGVAAKLFLSPDAKELLQQYRAYGRDEDLQALVANDLYQHLAGEVEDGRDVPAGSFRRLLELVVSMQPEELLRVGAPALNNGLDAGSPCSLLKRALGMEWWPNSLQRQHTEAALRCFGLATTAALLAAARQRHASFGTRLKSAKGGPPIHSMKGGAVCDGGAKAIDWPVAYH